MTPSQPDPHDPVPTSGPNPVVTALKAVLKPFASLRLTVVLLALGVGLVFFGTLAQKTSGLWTVVDKYFWSWVVMVDLQPILEFFKIFFGAPKDWNVSKDTGFPFPGGKLIGGLMFINLIAAHATRFKMTWKRTGIWLAHGGLVLLFIGEYITREFQVEQRMTISQGEAVNFTEDARLVELAFATPDTEGTDRVTVIPGVRLERAFRRGELITHPELPVDVRVEKYMKNSGLLSSERVESRKRQNKPVPENPATAGLGLEDVVEPKDEVSGVGMGELDLPSAYVTLYKKGTDEKIGTYLVSLWYTFNPFDRASEPRQYVKIGDTRAELSLRYIRYYKPFSLVLRKFRFDRYTGTEQAKNYSSDLTLIDADRGQVRDVHIEMNDPLRYRGETFYQANFDKATEKTTVLQVVRNPGWLLPYVACAMVGLGLLLHFTMGLSQYLSRQKKAAVATRSTALERWLPWVAVGAGALLLASAAARKPAYSKFDLRAMGRVPVVDDGRIKPLDTVARVYLRKISAREEFLGSDGNMHPSVEWLMNALATDIEPDQQTGGFKASGPAAELKVIRIENDQVLSLLDLKRREGYRYSLEEVGPKYGDLEAAYEKARPQGDGPARPNMRVDRFFESGDRDVFAAQVIEAGERIRLYLSLCHQASPLMLPPAAGKDWRSLHGVSREAFDEAMKTAGLKREDIRLLDDDDRERLLMGARLIRNRILAQPNETKLQNLIAAYGSGNAEQFADAQTQYREITESAVGPPDLGKVHFEVFLNEFAPAYYVIYLYVLAALLAVVGWVLVAFNNPAAEAARKSAFWLLAFAFVVHGFALFARMYLMDRPLVFVTNLYSTAVFIGWTAVGLGLALERIFPLGIGSVVGAAVGGITAILAHNLAASGDTLTMMEAVLDTNLWLATHVTTINMGYAATYVAGVIGFLYIGLGLFTGVLRWSVGSGQPTAQAGTAGSGATVGRIFGQLMYGVLCLATLLSFVGTVLGGIWADQSWGRFWGWDPKENGAVLIVLWNALILHARWCGLVKDRGIAVLTLGGFMITTWSYFGTNQLGVGLHAYGFNKTLAFGCAVTWVVCLLGIGLGLVPLSLWRSFGANAASPGQPVATRLGPTMPVATNTGTAAPPAPTANGHAANDQPNGKPHFPKGKKHKKK